MNKINKKKKLNKVGDKNKKLKINSFQQLEMILKVKINMKMSKLLLISLTFMIINHNKIIKLLNLNKYKASTLTNKH